MDETSPRPLVLIVSGPPCAGKTTLARRLAASFALSLMSKDTIKEVLFETLGVLEPLNIGGHIVELDMSDFAQLDYDQLCARVRQLWTHK